jgi:pimeloyl-ACP methyl ester carboxylesterase
MDHYADDLKAVTDHLNLKDTIHVGHSTGGGRWCIISPVAATRTWRRRRH